MYKIVNDATGFVWNRWGSAKIKPQKGEAITLYSDAGSQDQRFEMVHDGEYVYFKLCSDPTLVVNRHVENGRLMLWPLAESDRKDILFNTETIRDEVRLIMPSHYAYATAQALRSGANIGTAVHRKTDGTQGWKLVEVDAGGGNTNPGGDTQPGQKVLDIKCTMQMSFNAPFSYTACFASCLLDIANYYEANYYKGPGVTMDNLIAKGCVRGSDGYVYTSAPYFGQSITMDWASEAAYCKAITEQINIGRPVVVKISGAAGDHFITAVSGGANADQIQVNDPMLGRTTLRKSFQRKGQAYRHLRCTYLL